MKPYYEQAGITIYHGDCTKIMWDLPSLREIGLICADPPYGINHPTDYLSRNRGKMKTKDYPQVIGDDKQFDPSFLLNFNKPTILWGANYFCTKLPISSGWLVWDKERSDDLDQSTCELAWTNCVKGVRRLRWLWNGALRASHEELVHPTQKAEAVMKWCIALSQTTGTVLDPYMGGGTTLVAAKHLNRKAIGIELEEKYCEIAAKRLQQSVMEMQL